jgi:hypothetical protein
MALRSPMVMEGPGVTPRALMYAVKVCAEDSRLELSFAEEARVKVLEAFPDRFAKAVKVFVDYCHVDAWPKYWDSPKNSGSSEGVGIPWPLMIVTNLIANGVDESRAWEMPEAQAIWLSTSFANRSGAKVNILTTEEEEMMEAIRRQELPPQQG